MFQNFDIAFPVVRTTDVSFQRDGSTARCILADLVSNRYISVRYNEVGPSKCALTRRNASSRD
jgi:hypothetical protein